MKHYKMFLTTYHLYKDSFTLKEIKKTFKKSKFEKTLLNEYETKKEAMRTMKKFQEFCIIQRIKYTDKGFYIIQHFTLVKFSRNSKPKKIYEFYSTYWHADMRRKRHYGKTK